MLRSLEKEPERRYQQVRHVKTDVETIGADPLRAYDARRAERPETSPPTPDRPGARTRSWAGFPVAEEQNGEPVVLWVGAATAWFVSWGVVACGIALVWLIAGQALSLVISLPACLGAGFLLATVFVVVGVGWAVRSLRAGSPARPPVQVQSSQSVWGTRIGLALAVLSGLMIVGFAPRAWLSPKSEPNVTVAGEVTDAAIGQPVSGARVADNRYGAGAVARQEAWTAATGRYSLRTWYEEHALAASAPGYYTRLETLLTKPVGRASELRMDFQLQPTNSPTARQ